MINFQKNVKIKASKNINRILSSSLKMVTPTLISHQLVGCKSVEVG